MHILYTLTIGIIFCVACAYVSMQLQHHIMPRLIWSFIMVPVLSLLVSNLDFYFLVKFRYTNNFWQGHTRSIPNVSLPTKVWWYL